MEFQRIEFFDPLREFTFDATHKFWNGLLDMGVDLFGEYDDVRYTNAWMFIMMFVIPQVVGFIFPSVFLYVFEDCFEKYRIDKNHEPTSQLVKESFIAAFLGTVVGYPLLFGLSSFYVLGLFDFSRDLEHVGLWEFVLFTQLAHTTNDISFYWSHRAFHDIPGLYYYHKQHHEWKATRAIAAEFAGLPEAFITNFMPTVSGIFFWPLITGRSIHAAIFMFYLYSRILQTVDAHCGFLFPLPFRFQSLFCVLQWGDIAWSEGVVNCHHYFHHSHNVGNFGNPLLDWLFGTDKEYRKYVQQEVAKRKKMKSKSS